MREAGDRIIIAGQKITARQTTTRTVETNRPTLTDDFRKENITNARINLGQTSVAAYRRRNIERMEPVALAADTVYYNQKVTVPQIRRCNRFLPDGRTDTTDIEGNSMIRIPLKVYAPEDESLDKKYAIRFKLNGRKAAIYYPELNSLILGDVHVSEISAVSKRIFAFLKTMAPVMALGKLPAAEAATAPAQPQAAPIPTITFTEFHKGEKRLVPFVGEYKRCTVGCDPEFETVRGTSPVPASHYLYGGTGMTERLGRDGAGSQIEVRPKGLESAGAVVIDMRNIMRDIHDSISTIGNRYPLGGHIHVGVGTEYAPTTDLRWLLDYFIGRPTMKLSGTARSHYRQFGAYETKRWGFEYRTPPAAIFTWPTFARLAMKAAQKIVEVYINGRMIEVEKPRQVQPTGTGDASYIMPPKEDYMNYCDFSEHEYDAWVAYINEDYPRYLREGAYRVNVNNFWLNYKKHLTAEQEPIAIQVEAERRSGRPRRSASDWLNVDTVNAPEDIPAPPPVRPPIPERPAEPAVIPAVHFSPNDTFLTTVRAEIERRLTPLVQNIRTERGLPNFMAHVYGLRAERGDVVTGITVPGYQTMDSLTAPIGSVNIGLPYATRATERDLGIMMVAMEDAVRSARPLSPHE